MPLIPWTDGLGDNFKERYHSHGKLTGTISALHLAKVRGRGKEVVERILDFVIECTKIHLAYEDRLTQHHAYAAYLSHRAQHETPTKRDIALPLTPLKQKAVVPVQILNFLEDRLTNHIRDTGENTLLV